MSRRTFIKTMAGSAGLLGVGSVLAAQPYDPSRPMGAEGRAADSDNWLPTCARASRYRTKHQSSYDRTGGNADSWSIKPGEEREIFNATGAGMITHIWFTGAGLKDMVLRAYWDGNAHPSIEAPIGDFFGLNMGEVALYQSAYLNCTPSSSLNCYFPMPFRNGARITVTAEGKRGHGLYFHVDYMEVDRVPDDALYFHAQYRQATPNMAEKLPGSKNLDGATSYVFCETHGRGHLMGVTLGVIQTTGGWMGEGDEMVFVDDEKMPLINGTGLEDYFLGSWGFSRVFDYAQCGVSLLKDGGKPGGRSVSYRFHGDNPIAFTKYLKHTIEHGHANDRADHFYSCAYWYQDKPSTDFPKLPSLDERLVGFSTPVPPVLPG